MTRLRALVCFAVFLAVASLTPSLLHDAPPVIATIFGVGCGLIVAAITATVVVSVGDSRAHARLAGYWWRQATPSLMTDKEAA